MKVPYFESFFWLFALLLDFVAFVVLFVAVWVAVFILAVIPRRHWVGVPDWCSTVLGVPAIALYEPKKP